MQTEGELAAFAAIILIDAFGKFMWGGYKKEDRLHKAWSLFMAMLMAILAIVLMVDYAAAKEHDEQLAKGTVSFASLGSRTLGWLEWSALLGFYATIWAGEE